MSNTTSRTRGLAQRALALLMAMVLATTLTPSFALANEADATAGNAAEQGAAADGISGGEATAESDSASKTGATASGNKKAEASDASADTAPKAPSASNASDTANSSASKSANQAASPATATNGNKPAEQAGNTEAETVSATLKISIYGTLVMSHTFSIEKGKTVKDLLELADKDKYIGFKFTDDCATYDDGKSHFVRALTIKGDKYDQGEIGGAYWMSTISNDPNKGDIGIEHDVIDTDGYSYSLNLAKYPDDGSKYDNGIGDYPTNPDADHADKASANDTTSFVKNNGNTSTVSSAPTSSNNAVLAWKKSGYGVGNKCSAILTIGNYVYIATDDWSSNPATLRKLDAKTGKELDTLSLFTSIDSMCRMTYTDGVIVVPLSNGRLQGVSATTMKTLWVSDAIATGDMNLSTVTASNGMLFTGTTSDWTASSGTFFGINAITGECLWSNKNADAGYYWAGACKIGNVLIYGDNAGWLKAVDPATGKVMSRIKLSSAIQSTAISNSAETKAYVATTDGLLHEIEVGIDGSLSECNSGKIGPNGGGTSTPTLFEGNLYIGGGVWGSKGSFSVIDAATMQVKNTVELPYYVQSAPLVAKAADGNTYAYFTCNGCETNTDGENTNGGGAWVYCLETGKATRLFDATGDAANYCTSSIVMGADGTLYWTNDSGTLFALVSAASSNGGNNGGSNSGNVTGGDNSGNNTPQGNNKQNGSNGSNSHAPAAAPIATASGSAAAQTPLSAEENSDADDDASAEDETFGVEPASASSAHNASTGNASEQQIPWLPITGIAVGCAGLIGVGVYLFRRRSL